MAVSDMVSATASKYDIGEQMCPYRLVWSTSPAAGASSS